MPVTEQNQGAPGSPVDSSGEPVAIVTRGERFTPGGLLFDPADATPQERVTRGVPVCDTNHAQVHEGNAFEVCYSKQLAAGATMALAVDIPAGAYVHFQAAKLHFAGAITLDILEGATCANGTALVPRNRHRITDSASTLSLTKDVDTIVGGFSLLGDPMYLGAAGAANKATVGGATGDTSEIVMKPSTKYIFKITSLEGSQTINVALVPFWYEEGGA